MSLGEWELWACANEMIRHHGEDAAVHTAIRADELLAQGAYDGAVAWQSIVRRINELQAPLPTVLQ